MSVQSCSVTYRACSALRSMKLKHEGSERHISQLAFTLHAGREHFRPEMPASMLALCRRYIFGVISGLDSKERNRITCTARKRRMPRCKRTVATPSALIGGYSLCVPFIRFGLRSTTSINHLITTDCRLLLGHLEVLTFTQALDD